MHSLLVELGRILPVIIHYKSDFFSLPKVEGVTQFNMKIYNRWGELLFESNDRTVGWDGYYNGVLMPQGGLRLSIRISL